MVFDAFIGARSMSRYWPWYSLWGRKFLNSLISLAELPSSHLGLLLYLFLRFSLEFWLLAFVSPSSREWEYSSLLLPQWRNWVSCIWGNCRSQHIGVWRLIFTLRKLHSCPGCFPWLLLSSGWLGERALGLVLGAVLASYKPCGVVGDSA